MKLRVVPPTAALQAPPLWLDRQGRRWGGVTVWGVFVLFLFCRAALCSVRDLSSSTRDRTRTPCIGSRVNHWTTGDVIPLTHASAFTSVFNTHLPAPGGSISLHPQEGSGCGRRSRDIPAFLRLFYRVDLIQGIAVVSNEGPRRQKRNAEANAVGRKVCGDGVSVFWEGDTPPTHTPLLLDPPGLREAALRPTSVTWAIYQTLCASVCPTAKWANKHVCLYEVVGSI